MHRRVDLRKSKSRAGGNGKERAAFERRPVGPSPPRHVLLGPTGGDETAGENAADDRQGQTTPGPQSGLSAADRGSAMILGRTGAERTFANSRPM